MLLISWILLGMCPLLFLVYIAASSVGRTTVKVLPFPTSLFIEMLPLWASIRLLETGKPYPYYRRWYYPQPFKNDWRGTLYRPIVDSVIGICVSRHWV